MKLKLLAAIAAVLFSTTALADTAYFPCKVFSRDGEINNYNCTPGTPGTGYNRLTGQMEQTTYQDENGQQRVTTVPKYIGAICKDNICGVIGAYFKGEFVGNAPAGYYIIPRGWYLGPASNGSTVTYQMGTGPLYKGDTAEVSELTGEACYEQKMAEYRKELGEEAMVIRGQIDEWREQCGLPLAP
jgi:hypothetical protein